MKIYMHVNYIEWLDDLVEITRRCAGAGYDGIELRARDRSNRLSLDDYLKLSGDVAKSAGLDVVYGFVAESTSDDEALRAQSLNDLKKVIRHAGDCGSTVLNVFGSPLLAEGVPYHCFDQHGSVLATEEKRRHTVEYFQAAAEIAVECGVKLCFETHNNYMHDLPVPTLALVEAIGHPSVAVNFDYGNIFLHAEDGTLENAIDTLGSHIGYVHIKNMMSFASFGTQIFRGTPLRDGDINHEMLVRKLLASGYQGCLTIENVMPGDKTHLMQDDIEYFREVIERCGVI